MVADPQHQIAAVRSFNRGYTRTLGLLQPGGLYAPISLPEARVMYEIAHCQDSSEGPGASSSEGVIARDIGKALGLDPGYLSRLIGRLRRDKLIEAAPRGSDARRQPLRLTSKGREAFSRLDQISEQQVATMLAPLHPIDRAAVVEGMAQAARLWRTGRAPQVMLRGLLPGDLGWVLERHGAYYAEANGWGPLMEAGCAETIARFLRTFDPTSDKALVAERGGERLGSLLVMREDETTARIRLVMVEPKARGLGLGARLVREAVTFAREAGYARMILWTQSVLTDARRVYASAGFKKTSEALHTEFGPQSLGETWELNL